MWILRGTIYGAVAFVIFGLLFFFSKYPIRTNKAISLATLRYLTFGNPWFWAAFVLMVCTSVVCVRLWSEIHN